MAFLPNRIHIFSFVLIVAAHCQAQQQLSSLVLNNYTIPLKGKQIGKVVSKDGPVKGALITKDTSGLFAIDRNGILELKKKHGNSSSAGFKYEITVQAGEQSADFILVKDHFRRNKVIAHRGAWKNTGQTENSIGALREAIKMGCQGSEFDVHMSADSVLFVHHDPDVNGVTIEKTKASELEVIRLGNSEPLPALEAYLKEGMAQNRTRLILEIKSSVISPERTLALTDKVVAMVHALKAQAWVEYISFSYESLKRVRQLDPTAKLAYLNGEKSPGELKADKIDGLDYHLSVFTKNPRLITEAHKAGISTNIWTVNSEKDMNTLLEAGVDVITTNEPELLFKLQETDK